jgi:predicted amidohydrolase
MSQIIKAAVVQAGSILFDTPRTMAKVAERTREAAGLGAHLVVFPEAFVGGYPKGIDFGARLGMRSPEGREDFRRYYESAICPGQRQLASARSPATTRSISSSASSSATVERSIALP